MKYVVLSWVYKLYHFLVYRKWVKGILYRSRISGLNSNNLIISKLYNTIVRYIGNNNNIIIEGAIEGCNIRIEGHNNMLSVGCESILHDCEILLRGNNCVVSIGRNTRIQSNAKIVCQGSFVSITIGDDCLFSEYIDIWNSDTHKIFDDSRIINRPRSIHIGNHVWLGKGVSVLKGVSISDNSVIGMDSVVTRSISNNCIAAGNPAKILKENVNWDKDFVY